MLIIIFIFLTTVFNSKACIYKKKQIPPQDTIIPGHWNDAQYTRYVDRRCECGEHQHNETGDPNWNLFIGHAKTNPKLDGIQVDPVCIGTIITSNLVATVLRCVLTTNETTLNVYQAWMPDKYSEGMMKKSDIIVSTMSSGEGERFPVLEIIFATGALQHTLVGRAKKTDVHNDLLLLRVNTTNEFLGKYPLRPICLPRMNSLNFSSKLGTYYGAGEGQHPANFSSDYHYGVIDSKEFCDDESDYKKKVGENTKEQFQSICLRWSATKEMRDSAMNGGSLFIQSLKDGTAFIAGIEYKTRFGPFRGETFMFAYFTNILPMIKYIEYQANKHESKWCHISNDLVLPEPVKTSNHTGTDFEGPEIPDVIAENSWWCAEHQDILDKKAKTDWTRFAEGENALKDEPYKCNKESQERNSITFFQKDKEEPIGNIIYHETSKYNRRDGKCYKINKEWADITDIVFSTMCVVILEKCEDESDDSIGWYDQRERVGPLEKIHRVQVEPGEKINLEWFGLARRATAYRPCMADGRDSFTPVMFLSSNESILDTYSPWELCNCNNLNLSLGVPAEIVNEGDCLELYEKQNCTGWIRTVPGGRSFHSENLNVKNPNDKNPIKYPQVKSFSRCSLLPSCYELDTTMFRMVLKNKGVKKWEIPFKDFTIVKQVVSNPDEKERHHEVERDLSVINGTFKIQLIRVSSRPNDHKYFELEDMGGIGIPNMDTETIGSFLYNAYENVIHSRGPEPGEYIHNFWITYRNKKSLTIEMWKPSKCTVYEWISAAENVQFDYYKEIRIHSRMAGGGSLPWEKIKEVIAKDLGYDKVERCDNDGCWIRVDGKFSITVAGGEPQIGIFCNADCKGPFHYYRDNVFQGIIDCL